jgi:predicted outer membrane repeat protein
MKKFCATLFFCLLSALACTAVQAATLTVDSTEDALTASTGTCTLRGAVDALNVGADANGCINGASDAYGSNDAIVFDAALAGSTIPVTASGQIEITQTLAITGPTSGAADITLDGNNANRILNVTGGSSLAITGVRFINGNAGSGTSDYGGAVWIGIGGYTALNLRQCVFEGNRAYQGGAVHISNGTDTNTLTIAESTFSGNASSSSGSAVFVSSVNTNVTISNSTFSGNSTPSGGGAVTVGATVTISNSAFNGNSTINGGGGAVTAITATVSNSTFSNNTGGSAVAGGDFATISNSTFIGNSTTSSGGAVYGDTAVISNSTFSGNSADGGGGAVLIAWGSLDANHLTFLNNTAVGNGQAVSAVESSLTLHNSIIIGSNGNAQCAAVYSAGTAVTFTGSNNLEGYYDGSDNWQGSGTTCGTNIAAMPTTGTALSTLIESTLADNGGPTQTLALPTGSPAIGAADRTGGTSQMWDIATSAWVDATLDQRSFDRLPAASGRDVGAYEINVRFTPAPLPNGQEGASYASTSLGTASGGVAPYTFAQSGGTLPTGLTLNADGTLSGTPAAGTAGDYSFEVTITDADGRRATRTLTLTIRPRGPVPPAPTPVPTLSAAMLGVLGLLLAGFAFVCGGVSKEQARSERFCSKGLKPQALEQ